MTFTKPNSRKASNDNKNIFTKIIALTTMILIIGSVFIFADGENGAVESPLTFPVAISDIFPDSALAVEVARILNIDVDTEVTKEQLANVTNISIVPGLTTLQGIQYLTYLNNFTFFSWWNIDLLPLLELPNLRSLNVHSPQLEDLSPLSGLISLESLSLNVPVHYIDSLSALTNLQSLELVIGQLSNIAPLAELTNLRSLEIRTRQMSDITPLANLVNLEYLNLGWNQIYDISPLTGLVRLEVLDLRRNQIYDITPLSGLINLETITLESNLIQDITSLSGLEHLRELNLSSNAISNITPLARLENLASLNLNWNHIYDLTPIAELGSLRDLHLERNKISDITPLASLTDLYALFLEFNRITDITPLTGLVNLGTNQGRDALFGQEITLPQTRFENPLRIENLITNIDGSLISPSNIFNDGIYTTPHLKWEDLSDSAATVSWQFSQSVVIGNSEHLFSGTVTSLILREVPPYDPDKIYTIIFSPQPGTHFFHAESGIRYGVYGSVVDTIPANPRRTGYNFGGWRLPNGDRLMGPLVVRGNKTLTAIWISTTQTPTPPPVHSPTPSPLPLSTPSPIPSPSPTPSPIPLPSPTPTPPPNIQILTPSHRNRTIRSDGTHINLINLSNQPIIDTVQIPRSLVTIPQHQTHPDNIPLSIALRSATVTFSTQAMRSLYNSSQSTHFTLYITENALWNNRPVISFKLEDAAGNAINSNHIDGAVIEVAIPYTPAPHENPNGIVALIPALNNHLSTIQATHFYGGHVIISSRELPQTIWISHRFMTFPDIANVHFARSAIEQGRARDMVHGFPSGLFQPHSSITRAEFIQLIDNVLGLPSATSITPTFGDVPSGAWHFRPIMAARQAGLLDGLILIGNNFNPNQPITRQEMGHILGNVAVWGEMTPIYNLTTTHFGDTSGINSAYAQGIARAINAGFLDPGGIGSGMFSPNTPTTRAQSALLQMNMLRVLYRMY